MNTTNKITLAYLPPLMFCYPALRNLVHVLSSSENQTSCNLTRMQLALLVRI